MRKTISGMLAVTMIVGLLNGCQAKTEEQATEAKTEVKTEEVTETTEEASGEKQKFILYMNGTDEGVYMEKAMADLVAMDKYQDLDFEFVGRDADFDTKVPVAIAGGEQADLIIVSNPITQQTYTDQGLIMPLDDIVADLGLDMEKEFGPYLENMKTNDQIVMIPHNVTCWAMYYNKDAFDAAGVDYPSSEVPMTWDEYRELAKKVTAGEGAEKTYGSFYLTWPMFTYGSAIMELGGGEQFYNAEGLSNIEDPAFSTAIERVWNMMNVDESMPTHANVMSTGVTTTDIMNGKYAMGISGAWVLTWAMDPENYPRDWKIGVAPLPVDAGETQKTWGIVNGYGVPLTAADPNRSVEVAMDLVQLAAKYTEVTESASRTIEQSNLFVACAEALADDDITLEMLQGVFTNPDMIHVNEKIMGTNNVAYESIYNEEVEKYLVQEQDLTTTINNIKERADEAILE